MKKICAWLLLLLLFSFFYGISSVHAHEEEESDSSIHEMPATDNCSLITMQIRQLVYLLKQNTSAISSLQQPDDSESKSKEERQEYEDRLKQLQDKAASLRHQIELKESRLESCTRNSEASQDN